MNKLFITLYNKIPDPCFQGSDLRKHQSLVKVLIWMIKIIQRRNRRCSDMGFANRFAGPTHQTVVGEIVLFITHQNFAEMFL